VNPSLRRVFEGVDVDALFTTDPDKQEAAAAYRRAACRTNPLLFAALYMPHHITGDETGGEITFAEPHFEWADLAKTWARKGQRKAKANRHAFIAPRNLGKTTWWYLILPVWWAAYGYSTFCVAFANAATQAQTHLETFRTELDTNELLRRDFPELCALPKKRKGMDKGDTADTRMCANGFIFRAKGVDSSSLGMKVGANRPDTILLDDIEPDESNYSLGEKAKRLHTVRAAILALSMSARVVLTGTVTMYGSMVHDLVRFNKGEEVDWVSHEKFTVHHHKPFILNEETGEERSIWPEHSTFDPDVMNEDRHTRIFKLNYENDPDAIDSDYWVRDDFTYGTIPDDQIATTYLSIDGAVTAGKNSDYTGIAIVACANQPKRVMVRYANAVKLKGAALRDYVLDLLETYEDVNFLLIETNQGGDLWKEVFHDMGVPILTVHNKVKKETRATRLLNLYQQRPTQVFHEKVLSKLEDQMCEFPKGANDDMVDAVGTAVLRWIVPEKRRKARITMRTPV
jgi:phage terminase large subunit-like protein